MDLVLWRWSTTTQVVSCIMIAAFFVALQGATRRTELRWWMWAWLANLAALTVTILYWYKIGFTDLSALTRASYAAAKSTFAILLLQGAWSLRRPSKQFGSTAVRVAFVVVVSLLAAFGTESLEGLGVQQHSMLGVLFAVLGFALLRTGDRAVRWLAGAFFVRAAIAVLESIAWGIQLAGLETVGARSYELSGTFLAVSSGLDVGVEWLLALSCVLAVSTRREQELNALNGSLEQAQSELLGLMDRDALTGLPTRGRLPELFRAAFESGCTLAFLDLDEFKRINDRHGHHAGDAALVRFAESLRAAFRPEDSVVRYGGDEFVVVAAGLTGPDAEARLDTVRRALDTHADAPRVRFSAGVREVAPGQSADAALREADAAMYRAKAAAASR
ncbi:MAG: GGDEF domain-containing protein [Gemmatimonadaceae bacterium]|nr:GGDEF domain-containing protein [Gemmatimonadaceae bacterium]